MCGIISYVGSDPGGIGIILEGLKNLEHRGYDSMGIAFFSEGEEEISKIAKKEGFELSWRDLEKNIPDPEADSYIGIGHTRWASCGEVTVRNAHPHQDSLKRCSVVHNGNIENYRELKAELRKCGVVFASETDTEVIAHFFARNYMGDAVKTGRELLARLVGANAFVVLIKEKIPKLLVANRGGTLLIGKGPKGTVVASDPLAMPHWVDKRIDLESNEIALIDQDSCEIFCNGSKISKEGSYWMAAEPEENSQIDESVMRKEIFEQPEVIRNAMSGRFLEDKGISKLGGLDDVARSLRKAETFHFVGCGTANIACQYAVMLLNRFGIPARFWVSSEFCYAHPVFDPNDVFIFISQSGETADSIAVLEEIRVKGNMSLGFVNVVDSKIARMTDAGVYLRAGIERGVASTKAYTAQLVVVVLLAIFLARQRKMTIDTGQKIISELAVIPKKVEDILAQDSSIKALAQKYRDFKNYYFLGRYFNFITAQEGALKIKEISYVHAESYSLGEMKHGPLALIDESFCSVVVVPKDSVCEKSVSNIREIKARRGRVIAVASAQNVDDMRGIVDDVFVIPDTAEYLSPILSVIPLQLFAYHMACELGRNPDKPRNLAKTVTVE